MHVLPKCASHMLSELYMQVLVTTTTPAVKKVKLECPKCGTTKTGMRSCCAPGGAWHMNCADQIDRNFHHTWVEGLRTCKSKLST